MADGSVNFSDNGYDNNNNLLMSDEDDDEPVSLSQASVESVHFMSDDDAHNELDDYKVFNDPIHGHILLHPLLLLFIDTPQFQRLRHIKQLGSTYFVYPGASHNRFEHCIGTAHLAGKLARLIKQNQPRLGVTDEDVLCVELAGLCHDLGHGPYSHMFDDQFLPKVRPGCEWTHEKGSCMMLDYLIEDNDLLSQMQKYGLEENDTDFIKEMIAGPLNKTDGQWPYKGRGEEKSFLYEIVSNERNKVDVDKWDYFARDCHHLGISNSFDHNRFMKFIKVLKVEGEHLQICARDKESLNLYEMFHTRSVLHKRAYQHRVSKAIDTMLCEALVLADPHIEIIGKDGKKLRISQTIDDPEAYLKLTDNIFNQILYSTEDELKLARDIMKKIVKRKLYKCIGMTKPDIKYDPKPERISAEIAACDTDKILQKEDVIVGMVKVNYGMKKKNPIDSFKFFSKDNPGKPYHIRKEDVFMILPEVFEHHEIIAYCRDDSKVGRGRGCFSVWCDQNQFRPKASLAEGYDSLTPMKRPSVHKNIEETKKIKLEW